MKYKSQRGYSLIELSIALALLAAIIVSSFIGVQRILASNRANELLRTVPTIHSAIVGATANATADSIKDITTSQVAGFGAFPQNAMVIDATTNAFTSATNPFGGKYEVAGTGPTAIGTVPIGEGYLLWMNNIPQSMCATVVNGLAPLASGIYVYDGDQVAAAGNPAAAAGKPMDATATVKQIAADELAKGCVKTGNHTIAALMPRR